MRILISIDDTDDIGTAGTGEILEDLLAALEKEYGAVFSRVTRHQLLVHEDIPYTSHNSSMCACGEIGDQMLDTLVKYSSEYLARSSAKGSDPGLCVVDLDSLSTKSAQELVEWGMSAKKTVLTKSAAYERAAGIGAHLSEHGGTGQGVIGALAGAGLRLSGSDGRHKGKFEVTGKCGCLTVADLLASQHVDLVMTEDGFNPAPQDKISVEDKLKTVLIGHKAVLLVRSDGNGGWINLTRKELKVY